MTTALSSRSCREDARALTQANRDCDARPLPPRGAARGDRPASGDVRAQGVAGGRSVSGRATGWDSLDVASRVAPQPSVSFEFMQETASRRSCSCMSRTRSSPICALVRGSAARACLRCSPRSSPATRDARGRPAQPRHLVGLRPCGRPVRLASRAASMCGVVAVPSAHGWRRSGRSVGSPTTVCRTGL